MPLSIHVPAVPHTRPTGAFSHCAFTTKTRLLPALLKLAYPDAVITWYGVADDGHDIDGVDATVAVLHDREWAALFPAQSGTQFVGQQAHVDHPGYVAFNRSLSDAWRQFVRPGDLVCLPFGHAHAAALGGAAGAVCVETGIGYPTPFLPFRIYESRAWMHYCAGKLGHEGSDYHFVAPHYYDLREWPSLEAVEDAKRGPVVFVGRLLESKGLAVLKACAQAMPDVQFVLYGQGDPQPWLSHNVQYGGVLHRADVPKVFLGASATLTATRYIEPFCQSHVEALLCGCPVVGSDFGIFPETADRFRELDCFGWAVRTARTLPQFVDALRHAITMLPWERQHIASRAHELFSLGAVAQQYRTILDQILATRTPAGWYGVHYQTTE